MKSRAIKWLAFLLLIWLVFPATAWAQDVELPAEQAIPHGLKHRSLV